MEWWEKTVEYYFIKKYISEDVLLSPLTDNEDLIARDSLFSTDNKWVIIEFKRDFESSKYEKNKFIDYCEAKSKLENKDGHHFIVHGEYNEEYSERFYLVAHTYFSKYLLNPDNIFYDGIGFQTFIEYIKELSKYKKIKEGIGGSGGFSFVASFNDMGEIINCMSLKEFADITDIRYELVIEKEIIEDNSSRIAM